MFGGRKAGPSGLDPVTLPSSVDISAIDPRRSKHKHDDRDGEAGQCATCDSKVRWPRGATEFRCPTCLMINDMKAPSANRNPSRDHGSQSASRAGTSPVPPGATRALPITVERTKSIIDRCIDTYLETRKSNALDLNLEYAGTPPESPSQSQHHFQSSPQKTWNAQGATSPTETWPTTPPAERGYIQHFALDEPPRFPPPPEPPQASSARKQSFGHAISRKPLPPAADNLPVRPTRAAPPAHLPMPADPPPFASHLPQRDQIVSPRDEKAAPHFIPASKIFKPLENFLVRTYGDHESLNASFFLSDPRPRLQTRPMEEPRNHRDRSPYRTNRHADGHIQEIDAKTLLIGDFAENGMWWTGPSERAASSARRPRQDRAPEQRAPERSEIRIGSKTPLINWGEVEDWYGMMMKAGSDWHERARKLHLEKSFDSAELDSAMAEGRNHLHRALLKITEALLKRPGRPLKESSDIRFLLLLLANPLLYPSGQASHVQSKRLQQPIISAWDQGNAFGIIKRILGLLSNLPNDCHRHLTSWFARYDESKFRSYIDLFQRFLTYRLKRQHGRKRSAHVNPVEGLIPSLSGTSADTSAQLHAALGLSSSSKGASETKNQHSSYSDDWQVKAVAKVMAMLFSANRAFYGQRSANTLAEDAQMSKRGSISRTHIKNHGQLLSTTDFYNSMVDVSDPVADFDTWESSKTRFAFCQYPFFLSVGSKIRLIQHDAKRQMDLKAREAFFDSLLKNKALEQYLILRVRRDCLVEDSLNGISEVVASTQEEIKKGLRVQFVGEEGIDAGGLRKEWFLLLIREIFNPDHGLFLYDDDSPFCYFNPNTFETSDRYYLVGAVLGLAIYNSTILDVALPPFLFKKLLNSAGAHSAGKAPHSRSPMTYTLKDLAEYRPALARGLRQLLEFDGDVRETFQRDFVIEVERYGTIVEVPLCDNGAHRAVTNSNRTEFVGLYIRYILDVQVARQFEPFKRGFFTVCGGNALSLFQPEEIELLVRGSDEPMDVPSLRAVAVYDNWKDPASGQNIHAPAEKVPLLIWFWELFAEADPADQRRVLSFITGSDRIPAVGATSLVIKVAFGGPERNRLPIARTCFNLILLYEYRSKAEMSQKLWTAVLGSEGFGLK